MNRAKQTIELEKGKENINVYIEPSSINNMNYTYRLIDNVNINRIYTIHNSIVLYRLLERLYSRGYIVK